MSGRTRIAVAGATGRLGRHTVELLEEAGHEVVPMSRATGVDIVTGEGLARAVAGADVIVDAATGSSPDRDAATAFFTASARNLHAAGAGAGVRRMVVASIIGIDRFGGGYQAAKVEHERAVLAGPVPVHILRASQFHELVGQMIEWGRRDGAAYIPRMRTQLVAARAVAAQVVALATGDAWRAGATSEIAGPREERMEEAARLLARHRGDPVRIEDVAAPADPDAALYESGALLPGPGALLAGPTFAEWLGSEEAKAA